MDLSTGSIQSILDGVHVSNPILKVVMFKAMLSSYGVKRYRLNLTDGLTNLTYVLLGIHLNDIIELGQMKQDSIIRLDNYVFRFHGDKQIILVFELTVLDNNNTSLVSVPASHVVQQPTQQCPVKPRSNSGSITPICRINSHQNQLNKTVTIFDLYCNVGTDKSEYFAVSCMVLKCQRENIVFKACRTENCNKKLNELGNGLYRCERCETEGSDFTYRLILNMLLADPTGSHWVTASQEVAQLLLGKTAEDIGQMFEFEQKDELENMFEEALYKEFDLKLRVKNDTNKVGNN